MEIIFDPMKNTHRSHARKRSGVQAAPAYCSLCGKTSEPRPLGVTPPGWKRDKGGQGRYYCPEHK